MVSNEDLSSDPVEEKPLELSDSTPAELENTIAVSHSGDETPDGPLLEVGTMLAGKYKILGHLGSGGMSVVYKAHDQAIGRDVAIKMLSANRLSDAKSLLRFQQEGKAVGRLNHPNIVGVFDVGLTDSGDPFLVMDYAKGQTLSDLISMSGRFSPLRAMKLAQCILEALVHAHAQGVVHRDLKPSNIIVPEEDGGDERARVFDFGIAKLMPESGSTNKDLTQTGEVFGSPLYMSPEQCLGKSLDGRSDIYSLGCILYEMIAGIPPHSSATAVETIIKHVQEAPKPMRQICSDVLITNDIEEFVGKCLAKEPDARFQTAEEMGKELQALIEKNKLPDFSKGAGGECGGVSTKRIIALLAVAVPLIACLTIFLLGFFSKPYLAPAIKPDLGSGTLRHMVDQAQMTSEAQNGAPAETAFKPYGGTLSFVSEKFGDAFMSRLSNTPDLDRLAFRSTDIELGSTTMRFVSHLKIDSLELTESNFNLEFLSEAMKIKTLRRLVLKNLALSAAQMDIVQRSKSLENLVLDGTPVYTGMLEPLTRISTLRSLNLSNCNISDDDMKIVCECTNLVELNLSGNKRISTAGFKELTGLSYLESLDVPRTNIQDADLDGLRLIKGLRRLKLDGCDSITRAGLAKLASLKGLQKLSLAGCDKLSDQDISILRRKLPKCKIES